LTHTFAFELRLFDGEGYQPLPDEIVDDPEQIAILDRIKQAPSASTADALSSWELKITECPHCKTLTQDPSPRRITATKCLECDLDRGLWLCLVCGNIGCGRKNFDGSGGNGHGLTHFINTGHELSVKLGTISPDGRADVFCYICDATVTDSRIGDHLRPLGIDVETSQKTESTTNELEVEINKNYDFAVTRQDGREFDEAAGPFSVGLVNLGNTCYTNAVLQVLAAIPEFVAEFTSPQAAAARWTDPQRQVNRLFTAMIAGEHRSISPRLFRSVVCRDRPEFLTGQQQDAAEFFQYLFGFVKVHNPRTALGRAEFDAAQILTCVHCGDVATIPQRDQPLLILTPQPPENFDTEAVIEIDDLLHRTLCQENGVRRCDKCGKTGATLNVLLRNFPDWLFVAVQLDAATGTGVIRKMNVDVRFDPERFDLSQYRCAVAETVDERKVTELMNFGFARAQCVRALQNVGTVEAAVDWIVEHPMEQSPAVLQVMEMGFSEDEAREALEESQGNVALAIEWLFGPRVKRGAVTRSDGAGVYELVAFAQHKGSSALCGHYVANVKRDGKWILYNDEKVHIYPDDMPPQFGKGYLFLFKRKAE
jgi:ubiquitin carboxyl-terminal hydrolase 5/13